MRQWKRVFFTDESQLTLFRPDGRGERFADACVLERDRFRGGSVMVLGGISHRLKSPLIVIAGNLTGVRYRDEVLRPVAVPFVQQHHLIFQQDNARPHVARVCQEKDKCSDGLHVQENQGCNRCARAAYKILMS